MKSPYSKSCLDVVLDSHHFMALFEQNGWKKWPPKVPSNLSHSVILWNKGWDKQRGEIRLQAGWGSWGRVLWVRDILALGLTKCTVFILLAFTLIQHQWLPMICFLPRAYVGCQDALVLQEPRASRWAQPSSISCSGSPISSSDSYFLLVTRVAPCLKKPC